ncbi:MAG: hypothetical protein ACFFDN_13210 [Candidatus Hodarchaeota archaeon]
MLEITKAILYKTGIGYFERTGKTDLSKSNKIILSFKKKLMNDVLASLSVSGKSSLVTGVSYEGHDIDLARALEDALIKVPNENSFISLLKQAVGSQIEIKIGSEIIKGIVLGIQSYEVGVEGTKEKIQEPFLVLADESGDIRNIKIADMTGPDATFYLTDEKMNKELKYFLETIYTSKKRDAKTMTIFLEQKPDTPAESEVSISYLHEVPSWKASYRLLVFPGGETVIQGFGLIDNPTDEDWNDINLSLISGLPVSFIYDLYSPNWIKRPFVARKERYDITPTTYEEDISGYDFDSDETGIVSGATKKVPMALAATLGEKRDERERMQRVLDSTKVAAAGAEGGDFFQYEITVPVTVKRNQSSLVPILQSEIKSNRMSVYNEKVRKDNPMLTVELTNDTNLTLEEGPISVYEAGNFSGEGMLPFLKKDEKRRIGYAVDLGVLVTKKTEEDSLNFHQIKIARNLQGYRYRIKKVEYIIRNKTDEQKEVVIEHPKVKKWDLFETAEPFEESKNFYRYKQTLAPNSSEKLHIKTRNVEIEYKYYSNVSKYDIEAWYELKLINDAQRDFLMKIWRATTKLIDLRAEIQSLENDKNNISNDQNRLRQNIKVLRTSHGEVQLREKYIKKLENQEEILEKIEAKIEKLQKEVKNYEYLINKLNELNYNDASSLNNIAWGFWKIGDAETCVEYAKKSIDLDATRGSTWDTLACGLYGIGKIKESYEAFQKAIELKPKGEQDVTKEVWEKVKAQYQP